ncbi:MAG: glutathione S-transferase family protein [Gemmatimonadaceae bacterium]|nr:glutathione S-transferase family protein [Acetobacteraceae bacterium]
MQDHSSGHGGKPLVIYGAAGGGSVPAEAAMTLMGLPFEVVEAPTWEGTAEQDKVALVNPMRQIPALVLPSGEVMTESAAILMWLAEQHPHAGLAPAPGSPARAAYLRWMVFIPAAIYSMYWLRDQPSRMADNAAAEQVVLDRTASRIEECWRVMDRQVSPGRYILGDELTVLDLYVTAASRWTPRRTRFYAAAPKLADVVRRVDADPRLAGFWSRRYPFEDGWEG